jgi:hypothetical protein
MPPRFECKRVLEITAVWTLWKVRNKMVFEDQTFTRHMVRLLFASQLRYVINFSGIRTLPEWERFHVFNSRVQSVTKIGSHLIPAFDMAHEF